MKQKVMCNHPYIYPTQWNQSRPEPWHGETCDCGSNWVCPVCGFGQWSIPCGCHKQPKIDTPYVYLWDDWNTAEEDEAWKDL